MGQTDSKDNSKLQLLYQNYHLIKTFDENDNFGESKLLQSKKNPKLRVLLKEINITDEFQFNKAHQKYEGRSKLNHSNIINVNNNFHMMEQQLCGQFYKIFVVFEYFQNSLSNFIDKGLKETQLWPLLSGTIQGLSYLQENNIHHDCLTLENIYINADQMIVKVADPSYFTQMNIFTQILQDPTKTKNIYLSPILVLVIINQQQQKAIHQGNWQPKHNNYKSDVFSLGMIVLHAALNHQCDDCYNYDQGLFKEDLLQSKIVSLKQYFSNSFISIISQMLLIQEDQRPDFLKLSQILQGYQVNSQVQGQQQITQDQTQPQNISDKNPSQFQNQPTNWNINQQQTSQHRSSSQQNQTVTQKNQITSQQNQALIQQNQQQQIITQQNQAAAPSNQTMNILTTNQPSQNFQPQQSNYQSENRQQPSQQQINQQNFQIKDSIREQRQTTFPNESLLNLKMETQKTSQKSLQEVTQNSFHLRPMAKGGQFVQQTVFQVGSNVNQIQSSLVHQQSEQSINSQNQNSLQYQSQQYQSQQHQISAILQKDSGETQPQPKQNLDKPSRSSVPDENTDCSGKDQEINLLVAKKKYEEPLKGSQINNIQQPLQDFTNLFQNQDQQKFTQQKHKKEISSQNYTSNLKDYENYPISNHTIQQPHQEYSIQMQNNNPSKSHSENSKQSFSLPYDLPNNAIAYNVKYTEYENSIGLDDGQFMNHHVSVQNQGLIINQVESNYQNRHQQQQQHQHYQDYNLPAQQYSQNQQHYIQQSTKQQMVPEYVVEQYSNGSRYEGEKLDTMRHGQGKFYYQDGGLYDGGWKENKMHGRGVLYYATSSPAYDGDWIEDKFQGFGTLYNETPMQLHGEFNFREFNDVDEFWIKYQGQFNDDNKEGQGTLFLSNGERFVGQFSMDYINGMGIFYCLDGRVIDGVWRDNKLI